MESGSSVAGSSTHKEKLLKRQKANECEDKINKLPEPLVIRILSFLPIKDAVRTSVLSKKWIHRWTSITKLDIDDRVLYSPKKKTGGKQHFINFVNRILLLNECLTRKSVSLFMSNKGYDVSLVNLWISSIFKQRIEKLSIDSHFELPFSPLTSHSLFKCLPLEELVLEMSSCSIKVPTSYVYFGNLKLLKLSGITFTLDSDNNLELPVLKEFGMINCTWLNANAVTLKVPLLESVLVEQNGMLQSPQPHNCAIMFSAASHLTEFTIQGYTTQHIILLNSSSVHNCSVHIISNQYENRVPDAGSRAFQLLKQFSQVKYLKFEGAMVLAKTKVAHLPLFGRLSHLELGFVTAEVLLGLLLKSSVLKTLAFEGISEFNKELLNSATVPPCLTSTLQVVKLGGVQGLEHELCLAKFVMENGTVLKRMSFSVACYWLGKSKAIEEFKEKLFSFKQGFSFAIVEFTYD